MIWRADSHGIVTRSSEIKCYVDSHSWAMKLSQLHRQDGLVRVATYSLNAKYATEVFQRRNRDVRIICNSKFRKQALTLNKRLPNIEIAYRDDMHAKFVLIEPDTVYLGSMNLVNNSVRDSVVGIRARDIQQYYADWFDRMWSNSTRACAEHRITKRYEPEQLTLQCVCGWTVTFPREPFNRDEVQRVTKIHTAIVNDDETMSSWEIWPRPSVAELLRYGGPAAVEKYSIDERDGSDPWADR
jgi:hypothetical protein